MATFSNARSIQGRRASQIVPSVYCCAPVLPITSHCLFKLAAPSCIHASSQLRAGKCHFFSTDLLTLGRGRYIRTFGRGFAKCFFQMAKWKPSICTMYHVTLVLQLSVLFGTLCYLWPQTYARITCLLRVVRSEKKKKRKAIARTT